MSRYELPGGGEALYEAGSGGTVWRNLLGITEKLVMDQLEFDSLVREQTAYTDRITSETRFDAALLRQMHRDWLGAIYPWAGEYRRVNLSKAEFQWPPWTRVDENMKVFEAGALRECTPCAPGDLREVAGRIAVVHGDFLLVHPFLDGNGRIARWLADLMALQADLPRPVYGFLDNDGGLRERYLGAVVRAYAADYDALRDFFVEALERALEEAS